MADENTQGTILLKESDFVDIVLEGDESGEVVGSVPKHWTKDQLPPGTRKVAKSAKAAKASDSDGSSTPDGTPPVPAKSTSRADLNAYAVEHGGFTQEEAEKFANAEELHAALTAKAGQSA